MPPVNCDVSHFRKKYWTTHSWNMIHVWLGYHRTHGMLYRSVCKLIICVFLPNGFKIKKWTIHGFLEKCEISCVGNRFSSVMPMFLEWRSKEPILDISIIILGNVFFFLEYSIFGASEVTKGWNVGVCDSRPIWRIGVNNSSFDLRGVWKNGCYNIE